MSNQFKSGDRVRCMVDVHEDLEMGQEYTVTEVFDRNSLDYISIGDHSYLNPEDFELVDDLDALIATANAGMTAAKKLHTHPVCYDVEMSWGVSSPWGTASGFKPMYPEYRRKLDPRQARIAELEAELARLKAEAGK